MRKRKFKFPFKIALISFLCLGGILLSLFSLTRFFRTSDYFKIKEVDYVNALYESIGKDNPHYSARFIGKNMFEVDLKKESQRISRTYPEYKRVVLRRMLPDKIIVDFKARQAIALLKLSDDFYVDEDGVLFRYTMAADENVIPTENMPSFYAQGQTCPLPLIFGLYSVIPYPRSGVRYDHKPLQAILKFIKQVRKDRALSGQLKIKEINLANINDVFLFVATDCRINLGGIGSLDKNLSILKRLFNEMNFNLTDIEYIDLRFREPVVKYK